MPLDAIVARNLPGLGLLSGLEIYLRWKDICAGKISVLGFFRFRTLSVLELSLRWESFCTGNLFGLGLFLRRASAAAAIDQTDH